MDYIHRTIENTLLKAIKHFPVVAIIGPRQCGKSTLAKKLISDMDNMIYLDLELPSSLNQLNDPEAFFGLNKENLICLDEIQRKEELFPIIRAMVDITGRKGRFLILGSASPHLLRQSSESLAGRIAYFELTPFVINELDTDMLQDLWLRGGYPESYLTPEISMEWRQQFIRTHLERDIPSLGIKISANNLNRLWMMCAHSHGQILNTSRLGESLGVSYHTVKQYIDILQSTFMLRILLPYENTLKKRYIKSPKIYVRDSGILHALLDIKDHNTLMGHPVYGSSWEGFVIENIIANLPDWTPSYYRTKNGVEIDLILEKGQKIIAIECKSHTSPKLNRGFWTACEDLKVTKSYIVAPVKQAYPYNADITVINLPDIISTLTNQ